LPPHRAPKRAKYTVIVNPPPKFYPAHPNFLDSSLRVPGPLSRTQPLGNVRWLLNIPKEFQPADRPRLIAVHDPGFFLIRTHDSRTTSRFDGPEGTRSRGMGSACHRNPNQCVTVLNRIRVLIPAPTLMMKRLFS